jgi:hypothetical protein
MLQVKKAQRSNIFLRVIVSVFTVVVTFTALINRTVPDGYKYLFVVPILFGLYFAFSKLASYFGKSVTVTFFTIILILRYLVTPYAMYVSNNYSAMYYGVATYTAQQRTAVDLMIYELIAVCITTELCLIFIYNPKKLDARVCVKKEPYEFPNVVYVVSIIIGIASIFIAPSLLQGFNFLYIRKEIQIDSRNMFLCILAYFLQFIQVFVFLIAVKYFTYRKKQGRGCGTIIALLLALVNITFMWSANRMYIIFVTCASLAVLMYAFPEKKKTFITLTLTVMVLVIVVLSSYRIFGTTGARVDTKGYSDYFKADSLAKQLQIYVCGPDAVAGAVAVKDCYGSAITPKTFINDTFLSVRFIQQLPTFLNDQANTITHYYNQYCCKGYIGLICPMVGQCYIYFGAIFAPLMSVISVILMFMAERKAYISDDIGYKYAFTLAALIISAFPALNYTVVVQNIFNKFLSLFIFVWLNKRIYFSKKIHY